MSSLTQLVGREVLKQLKEAVKGSQSNANYCCGGTVEVSTVPLDDTDSETPKKPLPTLPTTLRYEDPRDEIRLGRIQFPCTEESGFVLDDLLDTCHRTGGLGRRIFSVDFDPNEHGIVNAIGQIFLPDYDGPILVQRKEHRSVVAELGRFKVSGVKKKSNEEPDILRGPHWLGYLIACLPHIHEGGQLHVSHGGHTSFFDWSDSDLGTLYWAAFHRNCDYKFLPVLSGHQLTLTYDLYVTEGVGGMLKQYSTADQKRLPLYEGLKPILDQENFMKDGCTFGFYCKHSYTQNQKRAHDLMPYALKGIDATIFAVFSAAGLEVSVRPMLNSETVPEWDGFASSEHDSLDGQRMDQASEPRGERITVGDAFHPLVLSDNGGLSEDWWEEIDMLKEDWPHSKWKNVIWLNDTAQPGEGHGKKGWEAAVVNRKYQSRRGDEDEDLDEELAWHLSHAVILVEVPKRRDRIAVEGPAGLI